MIRLRGGSGKPNMFAIILLAGIDFQCPSRRVPIDARQVDRLTTRARGGASQRGMPGRSDWPALTVADNVVSFTI